MFPANPFSQVHTQENNETDVGVRTRQYLGKSQGGKAMSGYRKRKQSQSTGYRQQPSGLNGWLGVHPGQGWWVECEGSAWKHREPTGGPGVSNPNVSKSQAGK